MTMRRVIVAGIIIICFWIVGQSLFNHFYSILQYVHIARVWIRLDLTKSAIAEKDGIRVIVTPNKASVGEKIDIYIIYNPVFPEADWWKYHLNNIGFSDKDKHFDNNTKFNKIFYGETFYNEKYTLSTRPRFFHFTYEIPSKMYSQKLEKTGKLTYYKQTEHPVVTGQGRMFIHYSPEIIEQWYEFGLGGEGYQGDGYSLSVPFTVK